MKKLSLNIQTFSELITQKYVYVDKTDQIHNLITSSKNYFLSRPRRFGKSLLVSTLESIFEGKRELFEGLAISKTDYTWPVHPIIKLDFSLIPRETAEELRIGLCNELLRIARKLNVSVEKYKNPGEQLKELVDVLSVQNSVVILIDEYDKPILDHIDNLEMAKKCQRVLKDFYEAIKALDKYCRFIFLTGVSKFTKTSVFSGLNNLNDISETEESALLVGYTKAEIEHYFNDYLGELAQHMNISIGQLLEAIKEWYDGYRFCKIQEYERLYAPLSVMYCLHKKFFDNYWFTTGTPSYLVNLLRTKQYDLSSIQNLTEKEVGASVFGQFDIAYVSLDALLYQAGYLTIKSYDHENNVATVAYPNKEIQDSMRSYLLSMELNIEEFEISPVLKYIRQALKTNNIPLLCTSLQSMIANIPYHLHIQQEAYYHTILQLTMWLLGNDVQAEVATSKGRIDLVVQTNAKTYILEFKFDKSPQEALNQIVERRYHEKYLGQGKPVTLVGINFDYQDKKIVVQHAVQDAE